MCGLTSFNRCATNINASASGLLGDCPDKACQLARDRGGDHGRWLTCPCKLAIPPAKSFLRLPRGIADRLGQTFLSQQLLAADPRREPIAPGSRARTAGRRATVGASASRPVGCSDDPDATGSRKVAGGLDEVSALRPDAPAPSRALPRVPRREPTPASVHQPDAAWRG